mgnify:CR=1 FL=1
MQQVASEDSLTLAKQVARDLNMDFRKERVREAARGLIDLYFEDIVEALKSIDVDIHFDNFLSRKIQAFADYTNKGRQWIFFDQHLHSYFFGLNLLLSIQTFEVPSYEEQKEMADLFKWHLGVILRPQEKAFQDHEKKLLVKYSACSAFANEFTYTMVAFVICHEIAHHFKKHLNRRAKMHHEIEADLQAYEWLKLISDKNKCLKNLKVSQNALCAPIISFRYFEIAQQLGVVSNSNQSHPSPKARINALFPIFNEIASENAIKVYQGMVQSLNDFSELC